MTRGGGSVELDELLETPGTYGSSGLGAVARVVLPCYSAVANTSSIWQRGMPVEMHQGNNFTKLAK